MVKKGRYYVYRDFEDGATFEVPDHFFENMDKGFLNTTILGDEAKMPGHCDATDSKNFHYCHVTTLPVGSWLGEHVHPDNEQFYLIVSGKAEITLCGEKFEAKQWSMGLIKPGGSHGIRNIGDEPVVYVCCEIEATHPYDENGL